MRFFGARAARLIGWAVAIMSLARPAVAHAQSQPAIGEVYGLEIGASWWTADPLGVITSERLGLIGSDVNFQSDLALSATRFRELHLVVRPTTKFKVRLQYSPLKYDASTILQRDITFSGVVFPISVPVNSSFDWTMLRTGIEYDFLHRSRGFLGVLVEARRTRVDASIMTPGASLVDPAEVSLTRTAWLPAIGVVARGYVMPRLAIDVEYGGSSIPKIKNKYSGHYTDFDVHATFNLTNNFGVQGGWRKVHTFLDIEQDTGDVTFEGPWFGASVRY